MICVVCYDIIQPDSDVHLSCGHHFHGQCISDWLWTKQSCPMCRARPNNPSDSDESDSDSDESDYNLNYFNFQVQEERRKTRRKTLNNIMRRKSLASNKRVETLKNQINAHKNILKKSRDQLRTMNKAISANSIEHRKKEAQFRRVFNCQLRHMQRVNREESKDFYCEAKSLERKVLSSLNTITKLEEKVLEYA